MKALDATELLALSDAELDALEAGLRAGRDRGAQIPPGSLMEGQARGAEDGGVGAAQAIALIAAKTGTVLTPKGLHWVIGRAEKAGRLTPGQGRHERSYTPWEVDVLAGETMRFPAGWMRRVNLSHTFDAYVDLPSGQTVVMALPYENGGPVREALGRYEKPSVVECSEWPTGTLTGRLERVEDRDGVAAYQYVRVTD